MAAVPAASGIGSGRSVERVGDHDQRPGQLALDLSGRETKRLGDFGEGLPMDPVPQENLTLKIGQPLDGGAIPQPERALPSCVAGFACLARLTAPIESLYKLSEAHSSGLS